MADRIEELVATMAAMPIMIYDPNLRVAWSLERSGNRVPDQLPTIQNPGPASGVLFFRTLVEMSEIPGSWFYQAEELVVLPAFLHQVGDERTVAEVLLGTGVGLDQR